jgi:hypothetical protein
MEQAHGSLFLATRSITDFGEESSHVLNNASTLLVHRSQSELPFEPYVLLPVSHPFFTGAVQYQSDQECFVIEQGQATQVCIAPVALDADSIALARESLSPLPEEPPPPSDLCFLDEWDEEKDLDNLFTDLFGKGMAEVPEPEPAPRQRRHARSKAVRNASAMEQKASQEEHSEPPRQRRSRRRTSKEGGVKQQQKSAPSLFDIPPTGDE